MVTQFPIPDEHGEHAEDGAFLTIGALAERCGVTVRTLRYYEEMDLIGPVKRTSGKYRLYNEHSFKRVKAILALQDLNYTLDEIVTTLGSYSQSRTYSKEEQISATLRSLNLQKASIDGRLEQLTRLREDVERRLTILDTVCHPCLEGDQGKSCTECHDYLEVHD